MMVFERYHQEVYRLCYSMLDDPEEAEDATQEVFLRAHRAWPRYDPQRAAPRTWLGHITMNYCRSVLRRRQIKLLAQRLLRLRPADDNTMTQRELRADLSQALRLLSPQQRSVILLRYYLNLSCAEIAQTLQISESTVYVRLDEAYERLHAALRSDGDHDE